MVRGVLLFLLVVSAAASATIDRYSAEMEVDSAGTVRGSVSLLVNASPGTPVTLRLPPASDLRGPPGLETVADGLRFPAPGSATTPVEIRFTSSGPTSKEGNRWNFSFSVSSDHAVQGARLRVSFPAGATLEGFEPAAGITARERLRLDWSAGSLAPGVSKTFTARYLLEPAANPLPLVETISVLAASTTGGFAAVRAIRRRRSPPASPLEPTAHTLEPTPRQRDLLATLAPREREVMEALLRAGGRTTQADLRTGTGLPKSTLSRTLAALQQRHLVEVRGAGHTNLVLLSELFLKG